MKSNNKEKLCLAQEVHVQAYVCVASRWAKKVEKYTIARRFHARRLHARIRMYTITARRFHAFCSSTAGTSAYSICVVVGILTSGAWRLRGSVVPFLRMHLVECGSRRVHPSRCLLCTWPALSNHVLQKRTVTDALHVIGRRKALSGVAYANTSHNVATLRPRFKRALSAGCKSTRARIMLLKRMRANRICT